MDQNIEMSSFPLSKVYPDRACPVEIYLFLDGHFIKLTNANDSISKDKFAQFLAMRVQFVFVKTSDYEKVKNWNIQTRLEEKNELINNAGPENEEVIDQHLKIKDDVLEFFTGEDESEASVQKLLGNSRTFIDKVKKNKGASEEYLSKIMCYSQTIGDHCTNVANLSVYLAMSLGYNQPKVLENIYVGALLHDYGKVVINLNNIDPIKEPQRYLTELKRHPEVGRVTLLLDSGVPEESILIIQEHHERHDGKGFPKEITGNKIYYLTKIVSIANYFDNIASGLDGPCSLQDRQLAAYKEISKDKAQMFDPIVLKQCLEALMPIIS